MINQNCPTNRARRAVLGLVVAAGVLGAAPAHANIMPVAQSYGISGIAEVSLNTGLTKSDSFEVERTPALAGRGFVDFADEQGVDVALDHKKWDTWASSAAAVGGTASRNTIFGWGVAQVSSGDVGKSTGAWTTANAFLSYEFALQQPTDFTLEGWIRGEDEGKFTPVGGFASVNLWGERGLIASLDWSEVVKGRLEPGVYRLDGSAFAEHDGAFSCEQTHEAGFEFEFHASSVVPTPGSAALAGVGAVLIAGRRRRTA